MREIKHFLCVTPSSSLLFFLSLSLICVFAYLNYRAIFLNAWFFDDAANFSWLDELSKDDVALFEVLLGIAGPGGRPISNISFLLNYSDWLSNDPGGFRFVSTMIHLINGLLLFVFSYRLCMFIKVEELRSYWVSVLAAAIWLLHPLNFTAILMPVQRMTILAGTFTILGLIAYVVGRSKMECGHKKIGLASILVSLPLFSVLGFFAKENGALLPFYCFCLEKFILAKHSNLQPFRLWAYSKIALFAFPALAIILYIIFKWPGFMLGYETLRDYNLNQRVATQTIILWDYARLFFVPNVMDFSPFNDSYTVYDFGSAHFLLALVGWFGVSIVCWNARNKAPILCFAFLWYLLGHSLESTVIPLELYFEHRNYTPIIGLIIALTLFSASYPKLKFIPVIFALVVSFSLWRVASLWSTPLLAAEMMSKYRPTSTRAITYLAILYKELSPSKSFNVLVEGSQRTLSASVHLTMLQQSCEMRSEESNKQAFNQVLALSGQLKSDYISAITTALEDTYENIRSGNCKSLSMMQLVSLIENLEQNNSFSRNKKMSYRLSFIKSSALLELGQVDQAIEALKYAQHYRQEPANVIKVSMLLSHQGRTGEGIEYLQLQYRDMNWDKIEAAAFWHQSMQNTLWLLCEEAGADCSSK